MKLRRLFTLFCACVLSVSVMFAQSSGDNLYNQGKQAQKTMTVQSQKNAIAKFQSAKKLYDSQAKKNLCDQEIAICQSTIAALNRGDGGGGRKKDSKDDTPKVVEPTLSVPEEFNVGTAGKTIPVNVTTNQENWDAKAVANSDGNVFVTVSRNGNSEFNIVVPPNDTYSTRIQTIVVTAANLTREITVTQTGLIAKINVSKNDHLQFKAKKESKKVEIECNSTQAYDDNFGANFTVESKPDWVNITAVSRKGDGGLLGAVKKKTNELMKGKTEEDGSMIKYEVTVTCDPLPGAPSPIYTSGRSGKIVFKSGDSTVTVDVNQPGSNPTANNKIRY